MLFLINMKKDETKHLKVFHSTCEDYNHYNLHPFKIIRRLTPDEVSSDDMPMWKIEFNDGKQIDAFVDEIFKL